MKNLYYIILFLACGYQFTFSQNFTCQNALSICYFSSNTTYPNNTNNMPSLNDGVSYGCLSSQPNRSWFFLQIDNPGILDIQVSQVTPSGTPIDVDYIVWGPFTTPSCGPSNLTANSIRSCSYSIEAIENFTINNAEQNQYYMLMLINFSNQQGYVTISQTNLNQPGSATLNCDVICPLDLGPNTSICENSDVVLTANIADASYQWSSSTEGILPFTTQSITVSPDISTTYTVVVNKPGCVANATDSVVVGVYNTTNFQQPNNLVQCLSSNSASFDLTSNIPVMLENQNPLDFDYGFFLTEADAQNLTNIILNPTSYLITNNQTIYVAISYNNNPCIYVTSFNVHVLPLENPIVTSSSNGQNIIVNAVGNGNYQYQIDNQPFQNSNVFENVSFGNHTITVISTNGCGSGSSTIEIITPIAPNAISPQYFNEGDTIANLTVNGENVLWYSSMTDRHSMYQNSSTPLPMDTLLIDGNTYYASQTVNGIESENRTPVLVIFSPLSSDTFVFNNLNYFPNPVSNSLNIINRFTIDSVEITSALGQQILSQKVNSLETEISLSSLSNGIYFVKVVCNGAEKTIKIIKE